MMEKEPGEIMQEPSTQPMHESSNSLSKTLLLGALLFVIALSSFLPAINGEFIWDDNFWLTANLNVRAINGLLLIWNPFHQDLHYYPVTFSVLWSEFHSWGLWRPGYHLVNMLLHASSSLLLWRILKRLHFRGSWLIALLWAIHPIQVESVAWISEIKNMLSGVFYFGAAYAYLRFDRVGESENRSESVQRKWNWYAAALFLFLLGMLSKSVICTFPAGLAIVLWWYGRRLSWRNFWPLLPILVVGLSIAVLTTFQENVVVIDQTGTQINISILERLTVVGKNVFFYLEKLAFPYPLMPVYPRWNYSTAILTNWIPSIFVLMALGLLWLKRNTWGKGPIAAAMFFIATISPALGFIKFFTMIYCFATDHYQYLASLGILSAAAEGILRLSAPHQNSRATPSKLGIILISCWIAILLPVTLFNATLYQSNFRLWSWNAEQNPDAFPAHHNLAVSLYSQGKHAEAHDHLDKALALSPHDSEMWRTAGQFAMAEHDYEFAKSCFEKSIQFRPGYGLFYTYLGQAYAKLGDDKQAAEHYKKGATIASLDPNALFPYAQSLISEKKLPEAETVYRTLIKVSPGDLKCRYNFGNLLLDEHKPQDAIEQYEFAIKYQKDSPDLWYNLAVAYHEAGRDSEAVNARNKAQAIEAAQKK